MNIKLDEQGNPIIKEGKPVYDREGREIVVDVAKLFEDLKTVNNESATRRHEIDELKRQLSELENLKQQSQEKEKKDGKKEGDELKTEYSKMIEQMKAEYEKQLSEKDKALNDYQVQQAFYNSKSLKNTIFENTPDFAISAFSKHFRLENGRVVGEYNGHVINDPSNPLQPASFDIAFEQIIRQHPNKDFILKGAKAGSGSMGNTEADNQLSTKKWADMNYTEKGKFANTYGVDAVSKKIERESKEQR